MTETAPAPVVAKSPAKKPRASKPKGEKKVASHPSYNDMVVAAIKALAERGGSSRQAITKYVIANYKVGSDSNQVNTQIKLALKRAVIAQKLKNSKGKGASGSFKITESGKSALKAKEKKVKKAKAPKKPAKAKTPKKAKKPSAGKKEKKPKVSSAVKEKKPKAKAAKPKASPSKAPKPASAKKVAKPKVAKPKKAAAPKSTPKKKAPAAKKPKTPKAAKA